MSLETEVHNKVVVALSEHHRKLLVAHEHEAKRVEAEQNFHMLRGKHNGYRLAQIDISPKTFWINPPPTSFGFMILDTFRMKLEQKSVIAPNSFTQFTEALSPEDGELVDSILMGTFDPGKIYPRLVPEAFMLFEIGQLVGGATGSETQLERLKRGDLFGVLTGWSIASDEAITDLSETLYNLLGFPYYNLLGKKSVVIGHPNLPIGVWSDGKIENLPPMTYPPPQD